MEGSFITWLPDSPWRSPAWRWLRASRLAEQRGRIDPRYDDDSVRRVRQFLAARGNDPCGQSASRPRKADPALTEAVEIFREEPAARRWRLEAYLLTAEPMEIVAQRCSTSVATAQAYHDSLFEVRPHLHAKGWIMAQAVRAGAWNNFRADFPGGLWKSFAYAAGALALELAIAVTTDQPFPEWFRAGFTENPAYQERRLRLLGKLLVAALTNDPSEDGHVLVQTRKRLRRLDHQAMGRRDEPEGYLAAMEGLLLPFSGRRKQGRTPAPRNKKVGERILNHDETKRTRRRPTVASLLKGLR